MRVIDVGPSLGPQLLWFNLGSRDKTRPWLRERDFRRALSYAVDREAFVRTVYLGAAKPSWGLVSPANRTWFSAAADRPAYDLDRARVRCWPAWGSSDRRQPGSLEDASGAPCASRSWCRRASPRARRAPRSCARRSAASACAWTSSPLDHGAMMDAGRKRLRRDLPPARCHRHRPGGEPGFLALVGQHAPVASGAEDPGRPSGRRASTR